MVGFFDDGYTIDAGSFSAILAQPMTLTPTWAKRVETYVFRDKTNTSVDIGKETDRLEITGLDFLNLIPANFPFNFPMSFGGIGTNMMKQINDMCNAGQPVYVDNLAIIQGLDSGFTGYYYITSFSYTRKSGAIGRYYYELTLDSET